MNEHSFLSEKLASADQKLKSSLERNKQNLDSISRDLKLLEQRLKDFVIPPGIHFTYQRNETLSLRNRNNEFVYLNDEIFDIGSVEIRSYVLSWNKDSHQNLRILHSTYTKFFTILSDHYKPSSPTNLWIREDLSKPSQQECKPLAECSGPIRLQTFSYLEEFYLEIERFLESNLLSEVYKAESKALKKATSIEELIFKEGIKIGCIKNSDINFEEVPF